MTVDPQVYAFLLPQFHPIPENDAWWGKGFTEWTNVAKARPRFPGHYQPHLPADLGFYDLRLAETRRDQAELAAAHGISAFCWYHYWFNGRRLLEQPLNAVLAEKEPDFPFFVCWANENWTRIWDGKDRDVLLGQNYSDDDDREHMRYLCELFADPRYVRIDGKPLFLVYNADRLPDPQRTTDLWREVASAEGFPGLHLGRVDRMPADAVKEPAAQGFDVAVEFSPDTRFLPHRTLPGMVFEAAKLASRGRLPVPDGVFDYAEVADLMAARANDGWPRWRCVSPGWDNSARKRKGCLILDDSTPAAYASWLDRAIAASAREQGDRPVVFVNAWNEWAEGAHLEPDSRWGRAYLEATRDVVARYR